MATIFHDLNEWKKQGLKIVFTNGCFDLLHPGHVHYLTEARALGDRLVVGLNTDESIRRLKGNSRPINSLLFREAMLQALKPVDLVIPFHEDTPLQLIKTIRPHVLVKGGDYTISTVVGHEEVLQRNGEVRILSFLPGYSSTAIIEKIKTNHP